MNNKGAINNVKDKHLKMDKDGDDEIILIFFHFNSQSFDNQPTNSSDKCALSVCVCVIKIKSNQINKFIRIHFMHLNGKKRKRFFSKQKKKNRGDMLND